MKKTIFKLFLLVLCLLKLEASNFGGWSISEEVYKFILENVPERSTILELGSGWASEVLSKHYEVFSVEHSKKWLGKYKTNYIYAPLKDRWYDPKILARKLPKRYKLLLIDGPPKRVSNRRKIMEHLDLFDKQAIIIVDDVHRISELSLLRRLSAKLNRPYKVYQCPEEGDSSRDKAFGVIL